MADITLYPTDRDKWTIDFSARLNGDTITGSPQLAASSGVTVDLDGNDDTTVSFWLSGGTPYCGQLQCIVATAGGRSITVRYSVFIEPTVG